MDVDVAIVGAGLVGAGLAVALCHADLKLALIEPSPPAAPGLKWDPRIYALSPASVAFIRCIGVWPRLDPGRVTPIHAIRVFGDDGCSRLDFSAYETGVLELAATVESGRLQHALSNSLGAQRNLELLGGVPAQLVIGAERAEIRLERGDVVRARLVVGADGANSWVRRAAGFEVSSRPYGECGVVANFDCARPHRNTAYQWFREGGVLAYLPLPGDRVSIVWSTPDANVRELLSLSADELGRRVSAAGGQMLGKLDLITPAAAFPLSLLSVRRMVQPRVVLIGDAAHVVHPLAGQGVNLGFGDAQVLAGLLRHAAPVVDTGDSLLLRRFERARAEDILAMRWVTDGLHRLFGAGHPAGAKLRNFGLNLSNSMPVLRALLARRAIGSIKPHKEQ